MEYTQFLIKLNLSQHVQLKYITTKKCILMIYILFQCKFEFCWICQESWKKHGSATGGFFRCNRMNAVCKADEKRGLLVKEVSTNVKVLFQKI